MLDACLMHCHIQARWRCMVNELTYCKSKCVGDCNEGNTVNKDDRVMGTAGDGWLAVDLTNVGLRYLPLECDGFALLVLVSCSHSHPIFRSPCVRKTHPIASFAIIMSGWRTAAWPEAESCMLSEQN